MQIVSFSGKKQFGKSTASQFLVDNYGFVNLGFADELKNHMLILNPYVDVDGYELEDGAYRLDFLIEKYGWDVAKEEFPEIRRLLQVYGTEVVRNNFGENVWVDLLFRKAEKIEKLAISDTRFFNELRAIKERKGLLIKIKCDRVQNSDVHASEQDLPDSEFDHIIQNNGAIEDLHQQLEQIFNGRY